MFLAKYWKKSGRGGCVMALVCLQACAIVNPGKIKSTPDETITSSLAMTDTKLEDEKLTQDGRIIRTIVATSPLSSFDEQGSTVWKNDVTGSRGVISSIVAMNNGDGQCRAFETTREAFDGVMIYEGEACQTANGNWILSSFAAK